MRNLKKEVGIILIGAMLIFFSSLSFNDSDSNLKENKSAIVKADDKNRQGESLKEQNLNSRLPASKAEENKKEEDLDKSSNTNSLNKPKGLSLINKKIICLETDQCSYSNNDPLEYSIEVYKDIANDISSFSKDWLRDWDSYSRSDQDEIAELLKLESGFIKKELLSFLNKLPTQESKEYYNLVTTEVLNYHDANLVSDTVEFLKKIKDESNEEQIAKELTKAIKNGSPHVAQEVSKHSLSFLTPKTRPYFADLKANLPENSPETIQVEAALIEHDMLVSGG